MKFVVMYDSDMTEEKFVKFINGQPNPSATSVIYIGETADEEALDEFLEEQREELENKKRRLN